MVAIQRLLLTTFFLLPLIPIARNGGENAQDPYQFIIKVNEEQGLAWFILSKPLRNFEKLTTFEIDYSKKHVDQIHLKQLVNIYEHKGRKLKEKYPEADGFYSPDGTEVHLIRYTDDVKKHHRLSNSRTIKGKQAYIWGKPQRVNKQVFELSHEGYLKTQQPALEETMEYWIKKGKAKDEHFDAIFYKPDRVIYLKYRDEKDRKDETG